MVFLYNTKCTFDTKQTGEINFDEMAWLVPIEAITAVKLVEEKDKKIELIITTDLECQNSILKAHGQQKVKKTERNVEFNVSRRTTARDFLWHLKRIHHWWNFAQPSGGQNNGKPLEITIK